ncbi:MAG: sulfotransferase [Desulfobacterales bacterium]|nr:sulfotransferase [Desulfobacterales bacterium]
MADKKKFVILTSPRTGSTYIRLWLNSHSQIRCHGELFLWKYKYEDGFRHYCAESVLDRTLHVFYRNRLLRKLGLNPHLNRAVAEYLRRFADDPAFPLPWTQYDMADADKPAGGKTVIGFKMMYNQLKATPEVQQWIARGKVSILHLVRENDLKRFVSLVRMKSTGTSHVQGNNVKPRPVTIPIGRMMIFLHRSRQEVQAYRELYARGNPYLEITYENFFSDMAASRQAILSFLGVIDEEMEEARLKKTSTDSIAGEIVNHRAVIKALSGTEFEKFLAVYQT